MYNKQEKILAREELILEVAKQKISSEGFFNLRMSDVAKEANISVGTLYTHFVSKEDLMVGVAVCLLKKREQIFRRAGEIFEDPVHRIIGLIMGDYLMNRAHGELAEVESLTLFPSVWKRASQLRTMQQNLLCEGIGELVHGFIMATLKNRELFDEVVEEEALTQTLNLSLWGVCIGLHQVFNSFCMKNKTIYQDINEEEIYLQCLSALLKGFGCRRDFFPGELKDVSNILKDKTQDLIKG
ncbi:TetR/AcrR family transcriptional regulator [Lentisphaera profundi]|uniref:TetR/AcrR family transcriptional regulator n=1 Tax=Lentisphaera profundi TaxID=1658616 RepID=A0ABY7VWY2_9BACT|nr:TetR/AcrR family transcriptional regulator [Lentisphaera profundi]WDE98750.1 TetR/AcrR family transcriptional regulator [Lentisphaera profundi]